MIACVDIQAAVGKRTGVGRYVKCLAENLGRHCGGDELRFVSFDFKRNGDPPALDGGTSKTIRWVPGRVVQQGWKWLGWPPYDALSGPADLFHFTNFIRPPLRRGKSVVNIYDISFFRFPEATESKNLKYLTTHIEQTVNQVDAVITISEFSRAEIAELLPISEDRILAVHPGLHPELGRPDEERIQAVRVRHDLDRPYLLFVGTIEPRKNIKFLVDVFDALEGFDGELVLVGMPGWKTEPILNHIRDARRSNSIRRLDFVGDDDLSSLYAGAELFVFPSLYEGFGFTPVESMACGTPVVSSTGGSLPEVLGDAAVIIEGFDRDTWAAEIGSLLADSERRALLREKGLSHVSRFTWDRVAERTWDLYRNLCE
jgi:glycosyltransferase involved in cell wall biosynthesis